MAGHAGCACGIPAESASPRCKVCPLTSPFVGDAAAPFTPRRQAMPAPGPLLPADHKHSRWSKSENSFGPMGRVFATIALLVPLIILIPVAFFTLIGIGGAGLYAFVVVPWGLKDIWKKTTVSRSRAARR